jgi:enamine deaminase RidA (YjgF/YER057c/UK114 family)
MRHIAAPEGTARAKLASDIVMAGGWAITSNIGPFDLNNDKVLLPEGVEAQMRKIFANLDTLLASAGLTRDNVVAVTVWLTDTARLLPRMNAEYAGAFKPDRLPARSVVGATYLTRGAQIEMQFTLSASA